MPMRVQRIAFDLGVVEVGDKVMVIEELICCPHIKVVHEAPGIAGIYVRCSWPASHYKRPRVLLVGEEDMLVMKKVEHCAIGVSAWETSLCC